MSTVKVLPYNILIVICASVRVLLTTLRYYLIDLIINIPDANAKKVNLITYYVITHISLNVKKMLEGIQNCERTSNGETNTNSWLYSSAWQVKPLSHDANLPQYTLSEVSEHCFFNDCWIIISDIVYDVTSFISEHPGGEFIIMLNAGRDATLQFNGHSPHARKMLEKYCIGVLVENDRLLTYPTLLAPEESS